MFNVTYPDLQSAYLALLQLGGIRNDTLADVYGDQKLYNDRTQAMETELLARLVQVRAGKAELPSLLSVIQELGAQRHALAAEMQSDHAADFGTSRMVGFEIHPSMITHLIMARYRLANEAIKVDMLVRIKELLARDKRQLVWTTATSRYTFERMNAQDMRAFVKEMGRPHDTLAETREHNTRSDIGNAVGSVHNMITALRLEGIDRTRFPDLGKRTYFIGRIQTKINDRWRDDTCHITWLHGLTAEGVTAQVEQVYQRQGWVCLLHPHAQEIERGLSEIEPLWKKMVTDLTDDLPALKNDLLQLQYSLDHSVPFARGSEHVMQVVMRALYRLREMEGAPRSGLDALLQPFLSEYLKGK